MTNETALSAADSDFDIQCIRAGIDSYRKAVRSRSRSGRDYSIARCDNRIHAGWRYEDSAVGCTNASVADGDPDTTANAGTDTDGDDSPVLLPGDSASERDTVQSTESDASVHAGAAATTAVDTGAVPSTRQRWSLAPRLLYLGKDTP